MARGLWSFRPQALNDLSNQAAAGRLSLVQIFHFAIGDRPDRPGFEGGIFRCGLNMSDATARQKIVGIERLRWVINFSQAVKDPADGMFAVHVDPSHFRAMTINGESMAPAQNK